MDRVAYRVRLLDDKASLRRAIEDLIGSIAPVQADDGPLIGLLGWTTACQKEVASLTEIRETHDGPVVAILAHPPNARGARVIAARLEGAVMASDIAHTLRPTLEAVAVGQCVVPKAIRQIVDRPPLSPRERQILAMIVLDFSNAEIARKLFVTESNVKNHLSSAFQKLGVSSRNAAAELILDRESGLGPGILHISAEESLPDISETRPRV